MGSILIALGVIVSLGSVFADSLGIGGHPGFGIKQWIGTILGIVIGIVGLVLHRKT